MLAQRDFVPLIRLPNRIQRMPRVTYSAIQRTTGDRVISLRKPLPAPIRSWVYGDSKSDCDLPDIPFLMPVICRTELIAGPSAS